MKKKNYLLSAVMLLLLTIISPCLMAQSTNIAGTVTDKASGSGLVGAAITVKGKVIGTTTDNQGSFSLKVNQSPPLTLVVSLLGYQPQELEVNSADASGLKVTMEEQTVLGQEIVVSASRVEEAVMKSPVSIEKMDIRAIRETPSASFYDALSNLKGVEMSTQSLTFKSVSTRGFNANGNLRVVQLIDGMDNQAPGLNFSVGNIVGISELDVESVELLPGAASALYGPNAINGIILMNSKSPFSYQGLSAISRIGLMNVGNVGVTPNSLYDFSVRYAKAFNNRFAFKVNVSYLTAKDWQATDYRDRNNLSVSANNGERSGIPGYNGVNVYGDETNTTFTATGGLLNGVNVSRTGYLERDLVDYNTKSLKLNAALHYRINDKVEAILQANYGFGTSVYTGADRYSLKNFTLSQFKAELKGSNFFLRAYTTQERSGDAYASGTLGQLINEAYNPSGGATGWFAQYAGAFNGLFAGAGIPANNHAAARGFADRNRPAVGSTRFNTIKDSLTNIAIPRGARFNDKTNLYHLEFMYNLSNTIKFADITVGANYRLYDLNSAGTIFLQKDDGSEYKISEYGGYVQVGKKLLSDKLKLTGSVRYDKNENFEGQFTPRISAVYTVANVHNIRLSYQTGFRIPPTQDQYINLLVPQARLVGGLPIFRDKYNMVNNPIYPLENVQAFGNDALRRLPDIIAALTPAITTQVLQEVAAGTIPNDPAVIVATITARVTAAAGATAVQQASGILKPHQFNDFKPERVQSYEIGYKSLIANRLIIDAYYYYNQYTNFSNAQVFVQAGTADATAPFQLIGFFGTRNIYRFPVSSTTKTTSQGWALGLDYALPKGYRVGGNVSYNTLVSAQTNAVTEFNTPRYRTNLSFANRNIVKNVGFNVTWRYQQAFLWQSSFALNTNGAVVMDGDGNNVPAYHSVDAQISYKIPALKSIVKFGAANLINKYYRQAFGNPSVGGTYYVSITFDELLN